MGSLSSAATAFFTTFLSLKDAGINELIEDLKLFQVENNDHYEIVYPMLGEFLVNDRQFLFEIFSATQQFLDFKFEETREISSLLNRLGCTSYLSKLIQVKTEASEPLEVSDRLTENYRARAEAISKYLNHIDVSSTLNVEQLFQTAMVQTSPNIKTHYVISYHDISETITRSKGGSSVYVDRGGRTNTLHIYLSSNQDRRACALVTDLPAQILEAIGINLTEAPELYQILDVPVESLGILLMKKGIIGNLLSSSDHASDSEESNEEEDTVDTEGIGHEGFQTTAEAGQQWSSSTPANSRASPTFSRHLDSGTRHNHSDLGSTDSSRVRGAPPETSNREPSMRGSSSIGIYNESNRSRNTAPVRHFASRANAYGSNPSQQRRDMSNADSDAFNMSGLGAALDLQTPLVSGVTVNNALEAPARLSARSMPERNEDARARGFEVGFLGENFIFHVLKDHLNLPNFSGEGNWKSSLRTRAGFSTFSREISDFTYRDTQGVLTRHFRQMQQPYTTPDWLNTALDNGNAPLYRLEVKSTTSQDPTVAFYMSGAQYALARRLRVERNTASPSEIYVVFRVSGLDALEEGRAHEPEWRVYLDPYERAEEGLLTFYAPTYTVTARV
ncbi:hypothetical protein BDV96DRAFT_655610 [Lophiotrema nucula]|uniref:Protein NO VEIN C-terminal domain-containing protein n=1 Tax=Lophiotrema nucula TaxID=690887 RepID=A0A6A5YGK8_9PLEO|nr:hypothetical protein BDV96DRAFT_655610 [Lophiotrema nucula]